MPEVQEENKNGKQFVTVCPVRLNVKRESGFVFIDEMSDAVDNNFNRAARFHGTDTNGSTAGDDVTWFKGHVMGDHADQFEWAENHVGNRIILAFLIVQNGFDNQFVRIVDTGNNAGAE